MSRDGLSYTKGLLIVYLLAGAAAALANDTFTPEFNQLVNGKPIQAIRDAYYNQIGTLGYIIIFMGVIISTHIRVQDIRYTAILLDIGSAIFWQYTVYPMGWMLLVINILAIGKFIYGSSSPIHVEG